MTLVELNRMQNAKELQKHIPGIHAEYCRLAGINLPYRLSYEYSWGLWLSEGWMKEDLATVIAHIKKRIKQKRRYPESLAFRNLICNRELFAELLAESKAESRAPTYGPRERVLEAAGRNAYLEAPAQTPDQIMRSSAAFDEFRKLKERLKP
jgi:hypothetical protein